MDYFFPIILIAAGVILILVAIWLAVLVIRKPIVALTVGLILVVSALTWFGTPALRLGILAVTIPHFLPAISNPKQGISEKLPSFVLPVLYVITCFISILWSVNPTKTAVSAGAWIILLLFIFTFRSLLDFVTIRKVLFYILLVFFTLSLMFLATPMGWVAGRAVGVFRNANANGIFTFLLIGLSIWMGKRFWIWVLPVGFGLIIATGSRAALLGLLVMLIVVLIGKVDWRLRLPIIGLGLLFGIPLVQQALKQIQSINASDSSVLRTNNSREDVWKIAFNYIRENPVLGSGYRATPENLGSSSYLKLVAEFGFLFAGVGIALAIAYLLWSRNDIVMLGVTSATLVNTVFEDWLLTAGAPMLFIYLLLVMSTPQPRNLHSKLKSNVREIDNDGQSVIRFPDMWSPQRL